MNGCVCVEGKINIVEEQLKCGIWKSLKM